MSVLFSRGNRLDHFWACSISCHQNYGFKYKKVAFFFKCPSTKSVHIIRPVELGGCCGLCVFGEGSGIKIASRASPSPLLKVVSSFTDPTHHRLDSVGYHHIVRYFVNNSFGLTSQHVRPNRQGLKVDEVSQLLRNRPCQGENIIVIEVKQDTAPGKSRGKWEACYCPTRETKYRDEASVAYLVRTAVHTIFHRNVGHIDRTLLGCAPSSVDEETGGLLGQGS